MKNLVLGLSVVLLTGCVSIPKMPMVRAQEAYTQQIGIPVTIKSIHNIDTRNSVTGVGGLSGATLGAIAGSAIGNSSISAAMAVIGLVAGGIAGNMAEEQMNSFVGLRIVVVDLYGGSRVVIQPDDCGCYKVGKKGYLLQDRVIME
jgi:outer membrane lipoprotein SlyB